MKTRAFKTHKTLLLGIIVVTLSFKGFANKTSSCTGACSQRCDHCSDIELSDVQNANHALTTIPLIGVDPELILLGAINIMILMNGGEIIKPEDIEGDEIFVRAVQNECFENVSSLLIYVCDAMPGIVSSSDSVRILISKNDKKELHSSLRRWINELFKAGTHIKDGYHIFEITLHSGYVGRYAMVVKNGKFYFISKTLTCSFTQTASILIFLHFNIGRLDTRTVKYTFLPSIDT
ncbi:hypothetical protein GZ77_21255 [Endozoicomonas montiporae]|uniref:Uncharacterized protein n=2 Tax=Endozoicomonas montiporae TaxID=1027273 RepID=A0A081N3D6_9GAMM|nr:hypothetical protein [Endozoicomonas montiporae]AMO58259.1 hypothetical protein EZMO1_4342 [Endozoicomonas montiporae CL-33]KEQ12959.1 hypothetical protein GZ77_21255 [Endozoicomonas montiporae]